MLGARLHGFHSFVIWMRRAAEEERTATSMRSCSIRREERSTLKYSHRVNVTRTTTAEEMIHDRGDNEDLKCTTTWQILHSPSKLGA